ncbi:hypothetical protein DFJ43DRAFT_1039549 [Lentinula guzmanii]|uniref:Uncharacterized protein n=1 Tax=Lentinula guzmanii TaxID=2804957 RepID=A0AA38J9V4_9AGAR|nr:hypothetical protein DFJ43DRAFT_1039549 [Lentinula guzmanii]
MSSPSSPTTPRHRLSSRRGSVSAPDPYAKHGEINLNPNRLSTSTLTIVKVVPNDVNSAFPNDNHGTISLKDPPGPGQRRSHRRIGSNEPGPRGRSEGGSGPGGSPRMSFAFSTFGPARPNQSDRTGARTPSPSSPSAPSRIRPSSPNGHRSSTSGYAAPKPKLTPEQLYDLAHQATHPTHLPSSTTTSPLNQRGSPLSYFHTGSPRSSSALSTSSGISTGTTPATFTPLHPSVYLPFIDRSVEVKALIESTPTRKLFALLRQTFPKNQSIHSPPPTARLVIANPDPKSKSPSPNSPDSLTRSIFSPSPGTEIPADPTTWTYDSLIAFMTTVSRDQEPDTLWVAKIRRCILSHSELIWERVKGALGVPPELDVDFNLEMEMNADVFESSESESESDRDLQTPGSMKTPKTEDMEDEGMKAKGHWDDWDAVIDSPDYDRGSAPPSAFLKSRVSSPSTNLSEPMPINAAAALLRTHSSDSGEITQSPTPVQRESRSPAEDVEVPQIVQQNPTPTNSFDEGQPAKSVPNPNSEKGPSRMSTTTGHVKSNSRSSIGSLGSFSPSLSASIPSLLSFTSATSGPNPETGVVIEPLVISPSQNPIGSPGLYPPPLSLPALLADSSPGSNNALGDILEGAEEEEEEEAEKQKEVEKAVSQADHGMNDKAAMKDSNESPIDPTQIHGLRISLPSSPSLSNSSTTSSPVFSYRPLSQLSQSQSQNLVGSLGRTGSLSQTRTDLKRLSWGSVGSDTNLTRSQSFGRSGLTRTGSSGSIASIGSHGYESEGGYDPVGDRAPGNPLFPSNFARLATGPTLVANNPSLRSAPLPPQSKYPHVLYGRANKFNRRGSNASGVSGTSNDYAITLESGSSVA